MYLSGESVILTDIGASRDNTSALVCTTNNVNTRCCGSTSAMGAVHAEWLFPDNTPVPRSSDGMPSDYATSTSSLQLRLNRVSRTARVGSFRCRVQDGSNNLLIHDANITLIIGKSLCNILTVSYKKLISSFCAVELSIPATLSVGEADGSVSVCATLFITPAAATISQTLSASLTTEYTLSASPGLDYMPVSKQLIFPAGSHNGSIQCLKVNITDDGVVLEKEETFNVTLNTTDSVILGSRTTSITIRDNGMNGLASSILCI